MPEGEHAWKLSQGPRHKVTCRVSAETHLLLEVAGGNFGMSATALAQEVIEQWAQEWFRANASSLRVAVAEEKAARAGGAR